MELVDLSQDFSVHTPAFASYDGPSIKWVKRLAFDKAGGQEITTTLHVGTHLDAPAHFQSGGKFIGELPLDFLVGPACVVDLERMGVGDYGLYGPEHFERWERDTGLRIERGDILVIHTGYHHYYNEDWYKVHNDEKPDLPRSFLRHPGPRREFCDWVLDRGIRWLAVDAISTDHPFNTNVRRARPDLVPEVEKKIGMSMDEAFPWPKAYQATHTYLFPKGVFHVENVGGMIDEVLDMRVWFGAFPFRFKGGEAAFCRCFAFVQK